MDISTFVFFDIETTGLPQEERNQTKIIELTFLAVSAKDIELTPVGEIPLVNKLSLFFNPERYISIGAANMTGLSETLLAKQPLFKERVQTLNSFLEELLKPVCLVAHNGNRFDFKILTAEYKDANAKFPQDLLCVDSITGFRELDKKNKTINNYREKNKPLSVSSPKRTYESIITDDEDEWPELNISYEEWREIDEMSLSMASMSCEEDEITSGGKGKSNKGHTAKEKISYTLSNLYRRLLQKEPINTHRAEVDCILLLECVIATKSNFLPWANKNAKLLSSVKPLHRY
ncbi:PREDICTED: three-prime repair exonuclease 1-like [Papilio polytes]|uniref:three-prime repair exonuclease 1-like n=1 Tax=Papilio polytes TaxID=76194 RepID=UPI0006762B98|nr:PREDICTED: three-prime repair exonuclease 1-like [Papilio polytes]